MPDDFEKICHCILRSLLPGFHPSIKIITPCPFSVSDLYVETKHAKAIVLMAFSDIAGNEVLFFKKVSFKIDIFIDKVLLLLQPFFPMTWH